MHLKTPAPDKSPTHSESHSDWDASLILGQSHFRWGATTIAASTEKFTDIYVFFLILIKKAYNYFLQCHNYHNLLLGIPAINKKGHGQFANVFDKLVKINISIITGKKEAIS